MQRLIDGYYTVTDDELYRRMVIAFEQDKVKLEPSALAGVPGMVRVLQASDYLARLGLSPAQLQQTTHLVWGTGGSMVPDDEFNAYLAKGRSLQATM